MKIKQLIAGGLATIAAGATLAFGAFAATTLDQGLSPYVVADSATSTLTSPAIVVGSGVDTTDVVGAADIAASLVSNYAVEEKSIPSTSGETSVTNGILLKSASDYPYLNLAFSTIKTSLTDSEMPDMLAKGSVQTNPSVNYLQLVNLGTHKVLYDESPDDWDEPVLNVKFDTSTTYDLKVIFLGGLNPSDAEDKSVEMFGTEYKIGPNPTNTSLTLYAASGAQTVTLSGSGDEETVTVGGTDYTLSLVGWDSAGTTAYVQVNGANPPTYGWASGNSYTLASGISTNVYVSQVSLVYTGADQSSGSVELFIGSDKIELSDTDNSVKKNDDLMTSSSVDFVQGGTQNAEINSLTFSVAPEDTVYLTDGTSHTDPLFGNFKYALEGMTPALTGSDRDKVVFAKDGTTKVKLTFTNDDSTEYAKDVFYYSSGWKYGDGSKAFHVQEPNISVPADADWIARYEYFGLDKDKKSYLLRYSSYDDTNKILTFTDLGSGDEYEVAYTGSSNLYDGNLIVGANQFVLKYNDTSHEVAVDLNGNGSIVDNENVYLYTKEQGKIDLSQVGNMTFTESPLYSISGNEPSGQALKFLANWDGSTQEIATVTMASGPTENQVGTEKLYRAVSNYGTFIERDTDSDKMTLYYPGTRPAYANVAIGTDPVISTTGGTSGGTYSEAVPITNPVAKFPSEITQTSTLNKDLILVGGPCANTLVKELLNTEWNVSDACTAWFEDDTLKTSGNGLIEVVEDVFGSGQKALIVAGNQAADTRDLIGNYVIKPSKMATLSGDQYKGAVV